MTRERAKEMAVILTAYAEGKQIQYKARDGQWRDNPTEDSFAPHWEYRIKPEPRYRPWKPEEVPVGAVVIATGAIFVKRMITGVLKGPATGAVYVGLSNGVEYSPDDLLRQWTLLDGTPCGVLE